MNKNYYSEPRPAQNIPTREQIAHSYTRTGNQSKQQYVPQPKASRHRVGHQAGLHPEDQPYLTGDMQQGVLVANDYEIEDDDAYYNTRLPTSARRYQGVPIDTRAGKVNIVEHYHDQPLRAHRPQLQPPRQRYTDEIETPVSNARRQKRSIHPLLYLGVGMIAMLALFVLLSSAATWIQEKQNDLTYGRPRTFQINFVVGHNDSPTSPSHFIAINLYRHVEVIEWPGLDSSKMKVYQITTLFGDGEDLTPVTLSFRDVNGDGKPDMLIHIEQQTLVMINDNGTFRPAKAGEVKGLL